MINTSFLPVLNFSKTTIKLTQVIVDYASIFDIFLFNKSNSTHFRNKENDENFVPLSFP